MNAEYVLAIGGVMVTIYENGKPIIRRVGMRSLDSAMKYAESCGVPESLDNHKLLA